MFKENHTPTEAEIEEVEKNMTDKEKEMSSTRENELAKKVKIRGIIQDIVELLAKEVKNEDIERLIGKGFTANFGEEQNIQTKIEEALKDRSGSEIEALTIKITIYKDALKK